MRFRVLQLAGGILSLTLFCAAQSGGFGDPRFQPSQSGSGFRDLGSVSGSVRTLNGKPLSDIQVQLHDASHGSVLNSAFTNRSGEFQFNDVPKGSYEVVAVSGVHQARDRVEVSSFGAMANLRMPISDVPEDGAGTKTVSVAEYQVPPKAREELAKAHEASTKMKMEDAEKHLDRALEIYPKYADALTLRGIIKLSANDSTAAIESLKSAIECDGNYGLAYIVLGAAYNAVGKFEDALQPLQRGQTLTPDSWQAYFEMGRAYIGKADYRAALEQIDKAQSLLTGDFPLLRFARARALFGLRQYSATIAELERYLDKNPSGSNAVQAQQMLAKAKELGMAAGK